MPPVEVALLTSLPDVDFVPEEVDCLVVPVEVACLVLVPRVPEVPTSLLRVVELRDSLTVPPLEVLLPLELLTLVDELPPAERVLL